MSPRVASMDQFRGYTVAGMFLVNFIGGFALVHPVLKHHNTYCSYADTIMPQFFFAAGFALRLVMLRPGEPRPYRRAIVRSLSLLLVGLIVYHLDGRFRSWSELATPGPWGVLSNAFWRDPFQALVHIAVTSLWILPVLRASAAVRLAYAAFSGLLHLGLSAWFWYDLLQARKVIDGGMLGFLTWSIPTLFGTLAYDWVRQAQPIRRLLLWGAPLMLGGYLLSCFSLSGFRLAAPPFWPPVHPVDLFTMSQRAGSLSYQTFSAGFSLALYALFIWLVDQRGWRSRVFEDLGKNALAGYLLHMWVADAVSAFAPQDSPLWWIACLVALYFGITLQMVRYLNDRQMYLRL